MTLRVNCSFAVFWKVCKKMEHDEIAYWTSLCLFDLFYYIAILSFFVACFLLLCCLACICIAMPLSSLCCLLQILFGSVCAFVWLSLRLCLGDVLLFAHFTCLDSFFVCCLACAACLHPIYIILFVWISLLHLFCLDSLLAFLISSFCEPRRIIILWFENRENKNVMN